VERGVRQGDPLSPLLYTLAIEPLLRRLHDSINGINIKNQEFKIAAYADDLTIGIGSQDDWLKFMEATKVYEAASNAKVNKSKTVLVPLTTAAQGLNLPGEDEFKRLTEGEPIAILGYKVDGRGNPIKRLWEDLAGTIQDKIKSMANRNLSFK
ncbi:21259_t:CDS:1, partial [Gigaspora rosea]